MAKKALVFEFVGMIFALAGLGLQIFFQQPLADADAGGQQYLMNQKLDAIWATQLDTYTHEYPDRAKMTSFANVDALDKAFHEAEAKRLEPLSNQAKISAGVTGTMFLMGSLLFLVGKYCEIIAASKEDAQKTS